jgi:hypothetical protein
MTEDKPLDTRSIRLELTVPCDERFRSVLSLMCERMAQYVGYGGAEAAELAATVARAGDSVLAHDEAPPYVSLGLRILTSETEIEFRVQYLGDKSPGDGGEIERLLSRRCGEEVPLEVMQRVMRRVEFGLDDGVEFCALSQALPEER